jgi:hypothetical protein
MAAFFPRMSNTIARFTLVAAPLLIALLFWICLLYTRSSYGSSVGQVHPQPIPFSHQHHVGMLGIDCRYCHATVEYAAYAGMPPTKTCMNCHSQIWVGSDMLKPVRESYRTGQPLHWHRVYNLPGFTYFDHHVHVNKGIGCSDCHGKIDEMPFTYQVPSLLMEWCLNCHRQPENHLRPVAEVFNLNWQPQDQEQLGRRLMKEYGIKGPDELTSCSVCHR